MINLFNLIPISPFDGGRIVAIVSPKLWLVGAPLLLGLFFWRPSPLLLIVLFLAAPSLLQAWRSVLGRGSATADSGPADGYYDVPAELRLKYGTLYLGLAGFLAIMAYEIHQTLSGH
mgnify:FL=1